MATFLESGKAYLVISGMWPEDADKIMQTAMDAPANEAMRGRWNDDVSGYPIVMMNVLTLSIRFAASKWLAANKPNHWARVVFDDSSVEAA